MPAYREAAESWHSFQSGRSSNPRARYTARARANEEQQVSQGRGVDCERTSDSHFARDGFFGSLPPGRSPDHVARVEELIRPFGRTQAGIGPVLVDQKLGVPVDVGVIRHGAFGRLVLLAPPFGPSIPRGEMPSSAPSPARL